MTKRFLALLLVFLLSLGTLAGCGGGTPAAEEAPASQEEAPASEEAPAEEEAEAPAKEEITIALSADITSLDPQGHNDTKSERVSFLLFNRLFRLNTNFEVVPDLAESWEQASDTEWIIKIKEGVTFHDGSEMTAEDVKFSLDRSKEQAKVQHVLAEVASVEVVDTYTVKVTTNIAFAPFLYTLVHAGTSIVPKAYVEGGGDFSDPIGSGPYTFTEWVSGDRVIVEKFDGYFDEGNMGQSKKITFRVIPEGTSRTIALETGEVDVVDELPTMDMGKIKDNSSTVLYEEPSTRIDFFGLNTTKAPFDNQLVRQAVNYAIDKEAIMIVAIDGAGTPAESVLAPSMLGFKAADYAYDPEKAKELLTEAGYPDGFTTTIWASGDERKRIAEVIQANFLEVGIQSEIEMFEWGAYIDALMAGESTTFVLGWTSNPDPDSTLTPLYHSDSIGGMNFTRTDSDKVDELIVGAREELNHEARIALYNELHETLMDHAPVVPLFVKNNVVGANANLKGVELSPQGLWNIEKIHY